MKNETEKRYIREVKRYSNSDKNIKDKKQLSKLKNGLKLLNLENEIDIDETNINKYKKEKEEQFRLRNILNAINRLKNKRLKLAFRLQIISGLRVSELSRLTVNDISFDEANNRLIIAVIDGKGGKDRTVNCLSDKWVLETLIDLGERKNNKLFYSAKYLIDKANKLFFHTHDLRKTFSQIFYFNNYSKLAVEELQEQLGHNKGSKTYLTYINRDINFTGTKYF